MSEDAEVLASYQRCLLALLRAGHDPATIRDRLVATPELAPLEGYLRGLDLHALAVAIELVAKWSGADRR